MTATPKPRSDHPGRFAREVAMRALTALIAATLVALAAPRLAAQTGDGQTFKDWRLRCPKAEGSAPPQCRLFQTVVVTKTSEPILYVAVGYSPDNPGAPVALFTLPLGIHLPSGVTMRIDDGTPLGLPIEHCDRGGCHARVLLQSGVLASLKAGLVAHIDFRDGVGQTISVPLSLKGFTAGLKALR